MTREQRAGLARLMLRWPEGRATLRLAGASDDLLLDLCESYHLACDSANYWAKSDSSRAKQIADEYRFLISESEFEVIQRVSIAETRNFRQCRRWIDLSLPEPKLKISVAGCTRPTVNSAPDN